MIFPMSRFPMTVAALLVGVASLAIVDEAKSEDVDTASLRGKVLCGYQGWFRCPGDAADLGWVHWSRDSRRIAPETLTFEMWPDMTEYGPKERFPAPGFTYRDGRQAELFTATDSATVLRHFTWMRDYGLDGAWLQRFVVGLPGGPVAKAYPSTSLVLRHVADAAKKTGRAWAISYDTAAMPADRTFESLTGDWKKLVDDGTVRSYCPTAGAMVAVCGSSGAVKLAGRAALVGAELDVPSSLEGSRVVSRARR
jgi:hypothetical protein